MFEKSYFETLQDYIASGCTIELTGDELDYYNALYALVGINRKYGKDNAIAFLMHEPFNVERMRARQMYSEAINLFYLNDTIENNAHRNMVFDNLMKAAHVVLQNAVNSKELDEKPFKVYDLDPEKVGLPSANRNLLAAQIDSMPDIPSREKVRLKRDANVVDIDFEEMLDDQEEKTKDIG